MMNNLRSKCRLLVFMFIAFLFGAFCSQFLTGFASSYVVDGDLITAEKRNQLLTTLDTAIGRSGPESLTASPGDTLGSTKWNDLVTKVNNYTSLSGCLADNGGTCKITATSKTLVDADLLAENIKSGINIFGITGTMVDYSNKLLLHFDNNLVDSSYILNTVTNNSATFDSTNSKFGGYSIYLNGTSYLSIPDGEPFALSNADFTVDYWFKTTDTAGTVFQFPYGASGNGRNYFTCWIGSNKLNCYIGQSSTVNNYLYGTKVINDGQWHHAAIVRSGTNLYMFVDGNIEVTSSMNYTFSYPAGNTFKLGAERTLAAANKYAGNIDEFRIIKNRAVWTNNFTVPSTQHSN